MPLSLIPDIHRATHQIGLFIARCPGVSMMTQGEAHILAYLHEPGAATVGEVHTALSHKRSTLSSLLNRLEERRFVVREVHPTNRKTFLVRLTPAGAKAAAKVSAWMERLEKTALEGITQGQQKALRAVLQKFETASVQAML